MIRVAVRIGYGRRMTVLASPNRTTDVAPWVLRYLWPLLAVMLLLRVLMDMRFSLVPDEAVYWSWSRHLALGYFDHPPMIAWINWICCHAIGATELGVRLPMTLMALGTVVVIITTAGQLMPRTVGVEWVAIMWLVSPLLVGIATISTPDTPAIFFSTCGLACAVRIAREDDQNPRSLPTSPGLWLSFGIFSGLALLSKYTTILLPFSVVLWLILPGSSRHHLRRPWLYLSALIALMIFSPDIWWNYRHQWSSFLFQFHHGISDAPADPPPSSIMRLLLIGRNLLLYFAGQALIWTPVLFVAGMVMLYEKAAHFFRLAQIDRLLLLCAVVPLAFFAAASAHKLGEMNWPAFTYVPLSLLTGRWICERNLLARAHLIKEGCKLALIFTAVIHVMALPGIPRLMTLARVPLPHSARDLLVEDRHQYGRELAAAADGALIICNRHQDAAEASFYMPRQPDVWCDGIGSRPVAYDYFDVKPDFAVIDRVMFVGGHAGLFMAKFHYTQSRPVVVTAGPARGSNPRMALMVTR